MKGGDQIRRQARRREAEIAEQDPPVLPAPSISRSTNGGSSGGGGSSPPVVSCAGGPITSQKEMQTSQPPRFLGPSPRSLYLTPVDHIVSGWGQIQGAPSFGPRMRGGCNDGFGGLFVV